LGDRFFQSQEERHAQDSVDADRGGKSDRRHYCSAGAAIANAAPYGYGYGYRPAYYGYPYYYGPRYYGGYYAPRYYGYYGPRYYAPRRYYW
jgi:hypothetical protein